MENLFISNSSKEALLRKKQNALLDRLIKDLKNAYSNVKHCNIHHGTNCTVWSIGCHTNENCTHSFSTQKDGTIKYSSYDILVWETDEVKYAKVLKFLDKYPKSYFHKNSFGLNIEGITEENIHEYISDITTMLEYDDFALRF